MVGATSDGVELGTTAGRRLARPNPDAIAAPRRLAFESWSAGAATSAGRALAGISTEVVLKLVTESTGVELKSVPMAAT